jgi:hypothetical protein
MDPRLRGDDVLMLAVLEVAVDQAVTVIPLGTCTGLLMLP